MAWINHGLRLRSQSHLITTSGGCARGGLEELWVGEYIRRGEAEPVGGHMGSRQWAELIGTFVDVTARVGRGWLMHASPLLDAGLSL
jgi:hypothetical protein